MADCRSLREKIRSGPLLYGCAIHTLSPSAVEVIGLCGADFVWIELEHAGTDMMQAEHLCRAAELRGMLSLLRIQDGSRTSVLRALEVGGKVIAVPQIHNAAQAAAVAEYGKFPPLGQRGFNTASRGLLYGLCADTVPGVFEYANRDTCLLVQIESEEGLHNAEAIIATPGIDGVLVGPGDLSTSLGIAGQWDNEDLIRTIEGIFAIAHRHEKLVATVCPTNAMTARWKAAGAHLLNVSGDLALLRKALTERLAEVRTLG